MTDQINFQLEFVLLLFCLWWGISIGLTGLITGIVAVRQIKGSQKTETGLPSSIIGMALGYLGMVLNIGFLYSLLLAFVRD